MDTDPIICYTLVTLKKGVTNMKQARIELLKQMNQHIIDLGDEEVWLHWIEEGVPDEASEDDYDYSRRYRD